MVCQKTVTIEITEGVQAWLTLNNADPTLNTDSVTGTLVTVASPGDAQAVPAVISNGVQLINGAANVVQLAGEFLSYRGTGFTFCFWNQIADMDVRYGWGGVMVNSVIQVTLSGGNVVLLISIEGAGPDTLIITPAAGAAFKFFCVTYDPDDGKCRASVDNGAFVVSAGNYFFPAVSDAASNIYIQDLGLGANPIFDEVALFSAAITVNQKNALWNGGLGQSYPPNPGPP